MDDDHGMLTGMERLAISKFKARCLAVLERVRRTGTPVLITKFGKPVAQVLPPPPPEREEGWIGCMEGTVEILGDIVAPAGEASEWEALRP